MRREGFCLRLGKLHIPLVVYGECLNIKIKSPTFLVHANPYGVNIPPWLESHSRQCCLSGAGTHNQCAGPAAPPAPLNEACGAVASGSSPAM